MPVVFAQPAPAGAFNQIVNQGNPQAFLQAYTAMSGQLQNRYASEAESNARERLGYANLNADTALRSRALGLQEQEMQQRPMLQAAGIEQRSRAEMDQWVAQQQFTARDQQELDRQRNSLGELMSKRDSGEITEPEFYQMASRVAPRINSLQEREKMTQQRSQSQMMKSHADMFAADAELKKTQAAEMEKKRAELDEYNAANISNRMHFRVDPTQSNTLAREILTADPSLAMNPAALVQRINDLGQERGMGDYYWTKRNGDISLDPLSEMKKKAGSLNKADQEITEDQRLKMAEKAHEMALKEKRDDPTINVDARAAEIKKGFLADLEARRAERHPPPATPLKPEEQQAAVGSNNNNLDFIKNSLLPNKAKDEAANLTSRLNGLIDRTGLQPGSMRGEPRRTADEIVNRLKQLHEAARASTVGWTTEANGVGPSSLTAGQRTADVNSGQTPDALTPEKRAQVSTRVKMLRDGYRPEFVFQGVPPEVVAEVQRILRGGQ